MDVPAKKTQVILTKSAGREFRQIENELIFDNNPLSPYRPSYFTLSPRYLFLKFVLHNSEVYRHNYNQYGANLKHSFT